jgi:sec-independent protein translocase protein TatB
LFDVAFSELIVIAIVALIVIGPEKLPRVARTMGSLAGRLQRYMANVKADVERELQFEDLQKLQQEIRKSVEQTRATITAEASNIENSIGGARTTDPSAENLQPDFWQSDKTPEKPQ